MNIDLVTDYNINPEIFRAYDIRGIVDDTLTEQDVFLIGQAIGTKTLLLAKFSNKLSKQVIIGRDGRLSGVRLINQLQQGIRSTGCDVVDLGLVPTPLVYFAVNLLNISSAIMLTGSHNPPNYNGLKIILASKAIYGAQILELQQIIVKQKFMQVNKDNLGKIIYKDIINEYINYISNNINIYRHRDKPIKLVIDCGNGVAGVVAEKLFTALGAKCITLYCEVDGNFPNHHPDPSIVENLQALQIAVLENSADLGIAFDGDGDRLGVIDHNANIICPDLYLMLFIKDLLNNYHHKNPCNSDLNIAPVIIYDIKSTNNLEKFIENLGGIPLMWKTGHSLIKAKMEETGALLAGEMSGHMFFKDRGLGFDDALYTAARLLELIGNTKLSLYAMCVDLPRNISTPEIIISSTEIQKHIIIQKLIGIVDEKNAKITTIDGVRLDFKDCWGLIRMSNTTPNLIARFEGINTTALSKIQKIFKDYLLTIDANLALPF